MANQKISELTAIITIDNSADVLPIVDISANTTKKVTPTQLKTALALDNVNNTSDANKPVSTAQQDALNAKVSSNAAITAGTAPKITFDAKGLVTSGDSLDETDLPTGINANKIGTGVVSTTEFEYLNGVTSAIQTQIDSKQATLVSGTNIKTVNSTSLLGSGDITISASPSGVAGAIQFSNGSAFASDASNLFWDDTNNRLGIGTNAPTSNLQVLAPNNSVIAKFSTAQDGFVIMDRTSGGTAAAGIYGANVTPSDTNFILLNVVNAYTRLNGQYVDLSNAGQVGFRLDGGKVGIGELAPTARLQVKGSGSTSATTSLLVQNSAGTQSLIISDDGASTMQILNLLSEGNSLKIAGTNTLDRGDGIRYGYAAGSHIHRFYTNSGTERLTILNNGQIGIANNAPNASAKVQIDATDSGFLPPRMTTTQKNAIATPASGLVVYDTTTNKLCCYNGSTWNDLF